MTVTTWVDASCTSLVISNFTEEASKEVGVISVILERLSLLSLRPWNLLIRSLELDRDLKGRLSGFLSTDLLLKVGLSIVGVTTLQLLQELSIVQVLS